MLAMFDGYMFQMMYLRLKIARLMFATLSEQRPIAFVIWRKTPFYAVYMASHNEIWTA